MVVVVELKILPVPHPGKTPGLRVPVLSGLIPRPLILSGIFFCIIPGRLILMHEMELVDGAVEGQGEAGGGDPQDGRSQCQREERCARRSGSRELEENAEDDAEKNAGKKRAEDDQAFLPGFSCLCMLARGTWFVGGRWGAFGYLFQGNLRAGSVCGAAGGTSFSSGRLIRPPPAPLRLRAVQ